MRHLNSGRKLNRTSAHRKALFKNMVLALIRHERIKTTDPKAKKLFDEIAPRFKERNGGYTRVIKFGHRRGDAAMLSIIEFTGNEEQTKSKKPKKRAREQDASVEAPRRQRAAAAG